MGEVIILMLVSVRWLCCRLRRSRLNHKGNKAYVEDHFQVITITLSMIIITKTQSQVTGTLTNLASWSYDYHGAVNATTSRH